MGTAGFEPTLTKFDQRKYFSLHSRVQEYKNKRMGMAGFEPESEALEAPILARLNYIP